MPSSLLLTSRVGLAGSPADALISARSFSKTLRPCGVKMKSFKVSRRLHTVSCSSSGTPMPTSSTWRNSFPLLVCRVELARQLIAGVSMLFFPSKVFSLLHLCCATPQLHTTMQVAGAIHITIGAATVHVITDALIHNRLHSDTYQRLLFGMALVLIAALGLLRDNAQVLTGATSNLLPNVLVGMTFVCVVAQQAGLGVASSIQRTFELMGKAVASLFKCNSPISFFYILLILLGAGGSGVMLMTPHALPHWTMIAAKGTIGKFLVQQCGVCFMMTSVVLVTLKDAGDRGRLGASTFVTLNRSLGAATAISAAVLMYSIIKRTSAVSTLGMAQAAVIAALCITSTTAFALASGTKG